MTLPPAYTEEKATFLPKQSSPWIRPTGAYVKSVEAREEMTSRYFAAIYFHIPFYGARVMTKEGKRLRALSGVLTVVF
jgi:hypothetical protein